MEELVEQLEPDAYFPNRMQCFKQDMAALLFKLEEIAGKSSQIAARGNQNFEYDFNTVRTGYPFGWEKT